MTVDLRRETNSGILQEDYFFCEEQCPELLGRRIMARSPIEIPHWKVSRRAEEKSGGKRNNLGMALMAASDPFTSE